MKLLEHFKELSLYPKNAEELKGLILQLAVQGKLTTNWREDNPDWIRDYSDPSTMPGVGEVGEWKDKLRMKHPGWNEVLNKVGKTPGANVRKQ